ncbi:MAG: hypothetical protein HYU43_05195, partial [Armatimonadetes bacterium]|nr:hypothetical protein [Armatimonadota bacterium]
DEYAPQALLGAVRRALATFKDQSIWQRLQQTGMQADFYWARSARKYLTLYERARAKAAPMPEGQGSVTKARISFDLWR